MKFAALISRPTTGVSEKLHEPELPVATMQQLVAFGPTDDGAGAVSPPSSPPGSSVAEQSGRRRCTNSRVNSRRPRHPTVALQRADQVIEWWMVGSQTNLIIETTNAKGLPGMFNYKDAVIKGALASYGESYQALGRACAKHVQRVLLGADPSTLPVEQFDRPEFFINVKTAKTLGLTIPPSLLLRADQVIE
jgi:hypothetical protein